MKKIITLILVLAVVLPTLAQYHGQKRTRFNHNNTEQYYGLRLGLNVASLSSDEVEMDLNSRTGVAFGAIYGLQLANSTPLWLETGLYYSEKGGEGTSKGEKVKCRLNYLQVPIVVKYSFDVYDDLYINPFMGGYLALGISGKNKNYGSRTSDSSYDTFNRFDGGLRIGCGVEYQMIYAELGFDFGLTDISKDDFATTHTQNFFINVGVNF